MKTKIRSKILFSIVIVMTIALMLNGLIVYRYFFSILKNQLINNDKVMINQATAQITYIQNDILKLAQNIIVDQEVQHYMKKALAADKVTEVVIQDRIVRKLSSMISTRAYYINSVTLISPNGNIYSTIPIYEGNIDETWYEQINNGKMIYFYSDVRIIRTQGLSSNVISLVHSFPDIEKSSNNLGILIINLDKTHFQKSLENVKGEFLSYILLNKDNNIILKSDELLTNILFQIPEMDFIENKDGFIYIDKSMDNEWKLIAFKSHQEVYKKLEYVYLFIIGLILASITVSIIINIPIISTITKPISKLTFAMKKVSIGDLSVSVKCTSGDEIETLAQGFNKMVIDLKTYISQSLESEKLKRKMQVDLLIAQINPHFIYNTLNCVTYLIRKNRNTDAAAMVEAFISVLQDTIKIGEEGVFATIKQEVEIINNYIVIQEFRYPNRFKVLWDVDTALIETIIPRSVIQPILENSIYHGIYTKEDLGIIKISITKADKKVIIEIEDNGVGMSEETVRKIMNSIDYNDSSCKMRSIGISNIKERLGQIYGNDAHLILKSIKEGGTTVSITVPEKI